VTSPSLNQSRTARGTSATAPESNLSASNSYLDLAAPAGPAALNANLWGEYYIQLLQNTKDLTNNKNTQYCLTFYLGGDDVCTLPPADVKRTILDVTHQDGPYNLLVPSFNLTSCQTKRITVYGEL
jgi:hypothetical protein